MEGVKPIEVLIFLRGLEVRDRHDKGFVQSARIRAWSSRDKVQSVCQIPQLIVAKQIGTTV